MTSPTKTLTLDSSYNVIVVIWSKFGNSSISRRGVIISSILQGFDQKNRFLKGGLGPSSIICDWY